MNSLSEENQRQSQIYDKSQYDQKQHQKYSLRKRRNKNKTSYYMEDSQDQRKTGKRIGGWFLQQKTAYLQFLTQNVELYEKNKKIFFQKLAKKIRTRNDKQVKKFHAQILLRFGTVNNIIDQYDVTIRLDNKNKCKIQMPKASQDKSQILEQHQQQAQSQKKFDNIKRQEILVNEQNLEKKFERIETTDDPIHSKRQNNQLNQAYAEHIQNSSKSLCNGNCQMNFWNSNEPGYQTNFNNMNLFYNGFWYPQNQYMNWFKHWGP